MSGISAMAEKNSHIPTSEIEQDILDTEREVADLEREAAHLAATPYSINDARWNHIRAEGRRSRIAEMKKFIEDLQAILAYRKAAQPTPLTEGTGNANQD